MRRPMLGLVEIDPLRYVLVDRVLLRAACGSGARSVHNRGSNDTKCNYVCIGYRPIRALVPRQPWPCGSIKTGDCRTTRQSGHGDDAKPGRRDVDFFRRSEGLLARCADDVLLA